MIVDAHCHIYPRKIAEKASQNTGNFYSLPMSYDGTVEKLLESGARAGVGRYVVESVATTTGQVGSINRFISEVTEQHPGVFYGLGTLHPDCVDKEEIVREIIKLGLKGVKLHPDIQRFRLDSDGSLEILSLCSDYGLPVLIHTGDRRYDYSNTNRLIPVLKMFPRLRVIGAHFGGWSLWEQATAELCGTENLFVDCSSSFYAMSRDTAKKLIGRYGADRVLFGSDYPMWDTKETLDYLLSLGLPDDDNDRILYKNAFEVFGLQ